MTTYAHLHEALHPVMALDAPARIAQLRADRWIDYPRAIEALEALEILLTTPPRTRMPCLLIYGDSGMGKTMLIEKMRRAHRPEFDRARRMVRLDVLAVQMPAKPSEARFYSQILAALGAPARPSERLAAIEPIALGLLRQIRPKLLVVDEVHNMLAGSAREQRVALNLLKFLANELSCAVVALGTRDAQALMQTDAQIASRFRPLELPRWRDDDSLVRFLRAFERLLPLREPSRLSERRTARTILERSAGITGEIAEMLTLAASRAIRRGDERITVEILDQVYPVRRLQ